MKLNPRSVVATVTGDELKKLILDRVDVINGSLMDSGLLPSPEQQENLPDEKKKEMIVTFSAVILLAKMMQQFMHNNGMAIVPDDQVNLVPGPPEGVMM